MSHVHKTHGFQSNFAKLLEQILFSAFERTSYIGNIVQNCYVLIVCPQLMDVDWVLYSLTARGFAHKYYQTLIELETIDHTQID